MGGAPIISVVGTKLTIIGVSKTTIRDKQGDKLIVKNVGKLFDKGVLNVLLQEAQRMKSEVF